MSNLFSRIFNSFTGTADTPSAARAVPGLRPQPVVPGPAPTSIAGIFRVAISELLDSDAEYLKPPYFQKVSRRGEWILIHDCPKLSKWGWKAVVDEAGGHDSLFPVDVLEKIATIRKNQDFCEILMEKHSYINVTPRFLSQEAEAQAAIARGQEPQGVRTREELERETIVTRKCVMAQRKVLSQELFDLLVPVCRKMQDSARKLAKAMDAEEKSDAQKCQVAFTPSMQLRMLLGFALEGACGPIMDFKATGFLWATHPDEVGTLWNAWLDIPVPTRQAKQTDSTRDLYMRPDLRAIEKEIIEKGKAVLSKEEKEREKEREQELVEYNKLHDDIRLGKMKSQEEWEAIQRVAHEKRAKRLNERRFR